ncbi:hypothetical protein DO71_6051 [Burkholderia pseudomallei]|nr:hypothetical protein DO71_6051 [Burkholderia pseudomallei]KGD44243.1 hypothetical protein DO72_5477 [Burkholderia pseudomallei]KGW44196.1 hypothetical protein Y597_6195 [Burkholderia pseudomallei MSHR1000]
MTNGIGTICRTYSHRMREMLCNALVLIRRDGPHYQDDSESIL